MTTPPIKITKEMMEAGTTAAHHVDCPAGVECDDTGVSGGTQK